MAKPVGKLRRVSLDFREIESQQNNNIQNTQIAELKGLVQTLITVMGVANPEMSSLVQRVEDQLYEMQNRSYSFSIKRDEQGYLKDIEMIPNLGDRN